MPTARDFEFAPASSMIKEGHSMNDLRSTWQRAAVPDTNGEAGNPFESLLHRPPPGSADEALADRINENLVDWAAELGIRGRELDRFKASNFARLAVLVYPDVDDIDRLLAAAQWASAHYVLDDHVDDAEGLGSKPAQVGAPFALVLETFEPANLTGGHEAELRDARRAEPTLALLRSAIDHLAEYGTAAQMARVGAEAAGLLLGMNAEISWRACDTVPTVWHYLVARQRNSFIPGLALIDLVSGFELGANQYFAPAVRRATMLAATAMVIVNDLYSMAKERYSPSSELSLPMVVAAERNCTPSEAWQASVSLHNEYIRTFESLSKQLMPTASAELRMFLVGLQAAISGNHTFHRTSARYRTQPRPAEAAQ
jgi:2-methylisoborneol synthase